MQDIEFAKNVQEAILVAVDTARKVYEADSHHEMMDAIKEGIRVPTLAAMPRETNREEMGAALQSLSGYRTDDASRQAHKGEPSERAADKTAGVKSSPLQHERHASHRPQSHAQDGAYHAAVHQDASHTDGLFKNLIQYGGREDGAMGASDATRAIPGRQEYQSERERSLCSAIEQLRQEMNRNHNEAIHATTRKNHSRP